MDAFQHIAANPAFNPYITEVIYDGRLFQQQFLEPARYYKEYELCVRLLGEEGKRALLADCERAEKEIRRDIKDIKSTGSGPSEREHAALKVLRERTYHGRVCKSMKQYVQFYMEQERILETETDKDIIFAGLKQMQNIRRLSVIDQFAPVDGWSKLPHRWYDNESSRSFGDSLAPIGWSVQNEEVFHVDSDQVIRTSHRLKHCRGITNLLKAAAINSRKITNLRLGCQDFDAPISMFHPCSSDPTPVHSLARGLTRLTVHLTTHLNGDTYSNPTPGELLCLKGLLQQSKGLISLVAVISLSDRQWKDLFTGLHFPHLVALHLGRLAYLRPNDLIGLLERHKASLRKLSIYEAELRAEEENWVDLAQRLGMSLELHSIGLASVVDFMDTGVLHSYSPDGYDELAKLFIPSYSFQEYDLERGLSSIRIVRRKSALDSGNVGLAAKATKLG